jgi:drug/metabolite transporter (DMT)-like permease
MFTTVSRAFLLINMHPTFIIILAWLFFKEKINLLKILSIILGLSGVMLMIGFSNIQLLSDTIVGDVLALITSFFFASYIILTKILRKRHEWYTIYVYPMAFALIWLIPLFLVVNSLNPQAASFTTDISMNGWLLVLGFVLFPTVIAHSLYFQGVKEIPATTASLITLLEPISAVMLAFLILNETLTYNSIIGGILILLGVYINTKSLKNG